MPYEMDQHIDELCKSKGVKLWDIAFNYGYYFAQGNGFYNSAKNYIVKFNECKDSDTYNKYSNLANAVHDAYHAHGAFYQVIAIYNQMIADHKIQGQKIIVKAPKYNDDYARLFTEIFGMGHADLDRILSWAAMNMGFDRNTATDANFYKQWQARENAEAKAMNRPAKQVYQEEWRKLEVKSKGLKIYHAKEMLEYCDVYKKAIANFCFPQDPDTDLIMDYIKKADNYLTAANMNIGKDFPEDVRQWTVDQQLTIGHELYEAFKYSNCAYIYIYDRLQASENTENLILVDLFSKSINIQNDISPKLHKFIDITELLQKLNEIYCLKDLTVKQQELYRLFADPDIYKDAMLYIIRNIYDFISFLDINTQQTLDKMNP